MPDSAKSNANQEADAIKTRRIELGAFLRERRGRLRASDVGIRTLGRRNVAGLRRDEVAAAANIGLSWYTMLEQGRVENVTARTLSSVSRALRLTSAEREHLFALAAGSFEELDINNTPPPPELIEFVKNATFGIAFILSPRFDVVAYNTVADRFFRFTAQGDEPNLLRIMLTDRALPKRFVDPPWHTVLERMIGHFRLAHGQVGGTHLDRLVEELKSHSIFAAAWEQRRVARPSAERSRITMPDAAPCLVNAMAFSAFMCPTYTIMFQALAEPGLRNSADQARGNIHHTPLYCAGAERRRRVELGAYLRHRRERMSPDDLGLVPVGRRHAKGLRRDEVAAKAGIGVSWYTMLEQGHVESVSHRTLRAVADALLLAHRERLYLERLSAQSFEDFGESESAVPEDLLRFIRSFPDGHAHFHDVHFNMLAWNADAEELYEFSNSAQPNLLKTMVKNAAMRSRFVDPNWRESLKRMLAHYRFTHAGHQEPASDPLIAHLSRESPEFAEIWAGERTVLNPAVEPGNLRYPKSGARKINVLVLAPSGCPSHTLVVKARRS